MSLFNPPAGLLTAVGNAGGGGKFSLASREWFDLQNQVSAVLALPSNVDEYAIRYGDPSSGQQMKACFDAMQDLQFVARKYGSPGRLRRALTQNPNALAGTVRPTNDAYSATIWTVQKAHRDAFALASALRTIPTTARGENPKEVVEGIKSMFLDADQLLSGMRQTRDQFDALLAEFESLQKELETAQEEMQTFTGKASKTMTALNSEIGETQATITRLERDRDAAYQKWVDFTIASCVVAAVIAIVGIAVSVILAAPTAGASAFVGSAVAVGVGGAVGAGLGIAASVARTSYDDLVKLVEASQEFLRKRIAYRHDLGALDQLMKFSVPTSAGLINTLVVIRDAWSASIDEIQGRVNQLTVDNLADGPWLRQEAMSVASANWFNVDDALRAFSLGAFVDPDVIAFGAPLPQDDPHWAANVQQKLRLVA